MEKNMKKVFKLLTLFISVSFLNADWVNENINYPFNPDAILFENDGKEFEKYEECSKVANSTIQAFIDNIQSGNVVDYCYNNMPLSWKIYLKTISPQFADSIGKDIINKVNELLILCGDICLNQSEFLMATIDKEEYPLFSNKSDYENFGELLKKLSLTLTYNNLKKSNLEEIAKSCVFKPQFSEVKYFISNSYIHNFPYALAELPYYQSMPVVESVFVYYYKATHGDVMAERVILPMVCIENKWVPLELANNFNTYFIKDTPEFLEEVNEYVKENKDKILVGLNGLIALVTDLSKETDKNLFTAKFKAIEFFISTTFE